MAKIQIGAHRAKIPVTNIQVKCTSPNAEAKGSGSLEQNGTLLIGKLTWTFSGPEKTQKAPELSLLEAVCTVTGKTDDGKALPFSKCKVASVKRGGETKLKKA